MTRNRGERGATAVEYALMLVGLAAAIIIVTFALKDVIAVYFENCAAPGLESGENDC